MIAALLLLGLLPFAAMPILESNFGPGQPPEPDPDTPHGTEDTPLDDMAGGSSDDDASRDGARHLLAAGPGEHSFPDFQPGEDSVVLDLTGVGDDLFFDTATSDDTARLSIAFADDEVMTLTFPGLQDVPTADVFLSVLDLSSGDLLEISLDEASTILGDVVVDPTDPDTPDRPGPDGEDDVIDPVDPDTPDAPGPEVDGPVVDPVNPDEADDTPDVLDPVDPDTPDQPGPDVAGDVLDPVDPDTPDSPGPDGTNDVLDPVDPDAELASSGWQTGSAAMPAEVQGFAPGDDLLRIQVGDDWVADGPPHVQVAPSQDGADADVLLNGTRIAVLNGAPYTTEADIRLDVGP